MGDLAIIIVTYNSGESIGRLLRSIAPAYPGGSPRVIVVDNASTDDTLARVAEHPRVEVIRSRNEGYSAGINRGVEHSPRADAHLILNPDLELTPGAIAAMLAEFDAPNVGIVAPLVLGPQGDIEHSQRREPTLLRAAGLGFTGLPVFSEYVQEPEAYTHAVTVDWALGAALLVRRDCSLNVGGWDKSYFLYSEETDYCARARAAGWSILFTPAAQVVHAGGGSGRNDRTHVMQIVNRVRYYARAHSRPASAAYWALTILSEATWVVRGHSQSKASIGALMKPGSRPEELGCGEHLIPR
ncbi:glycosyltransferase family 2 protein [Microbacterium paulum]